MSTCAILEPAPLRPLAPEAPPPALRPRLRGRMWLSAAELGMEDGLPRLWLHLDDGRVLVLALRGLGEASPGDDGLLEPIVTAMADDPRGSRLSIEPAPGIQAHLLWGAPVAPLPLPGGDAALPLRPAVQAWLAGLDAAVMHWLTGASGPARFWATVRNYNRLALLPATQRLHRLQALERFPALVAPLLLTALRGPVLTPGNRRAWRRPAPDVELAIDAGRDLTGALARHWRISAALVRSRLPDALLDQPYAERRRLLQLLDALPAHQRPRDAAALHRWLPQIDTLFDWLRGSGGDAQARRAMWSGAFRDGWDATWARCQTVTGADADPRRLDLALQDARDWLAALADEATGLLQRHPPVAPGEVAALWLHRRGLAGLLADSRRWHEAPRPDAGLGEPNLHWPALLGRWSQGHRHATELLSAAELAAEGRDMKHCVGGYWQQCLAGVRIFSLRCDLLNDRATAQFQPVPGAPDGRYRLVQLRGRYNLEATPAMQRLATAVLDVINAAAQRPARLHVLQARRIPIGPVERQPRPALDADSRRRLSRWIDALREPPQPQLPWQGWVAGLPYHEGLRCLPRIEVGDPLRLIPEPDNGHDGLAVRVVWQGCKLGYVPRPDNAGIARLLRAGRPLAARVEWVGGQALAFVIDEAKGTDQVP